LPVVKASVLTMRMPLALHVGDRLVFNAAGFIATRVSAASPGVWISSRLEKLTWKPLTP
jgi:hypothetical protein